MALKKRIIDFENRSVALFAALTLGGAVSVYAQTAPSTNGIPPSKGPWTTAQINQAFRLLDANGDGVISREEAQVSKGVTRHFERADTDRDGALTLTEFEAALKTS